MGECAKSSGNTSERPSREGKKGDGSQLVTSVGGVSGKVITASLRKIANKPASAGKRRREGRRVLIS